MADSERRIRLFRKACLPKLPPPLQLLQSIFPDINEDLAPTDDVEP